MGRLAALIYVQPRQLHLVLRLTSVAVAVVYNSASNPPATPGGSEVIMGFPIKNRKISILFTTGKSLCVFAPFAFLLSGVFSLKAVAADIQFKSENIVLMGDATGKDRTLASIKDESGSKISVNYKIADTDSALNLPSISALAYYREQGNDAGKPVDHSESILRETFLRAVEQAAERSPTIKRALAEQSAAQSDIDEAKGQRLPQLDIGTRSQSKEFGSGERSNSGDQAVTIDIVTPVFDWGRIRKTVESRSYLASAAEASVQAELEASAFEVTSDLIELGKQRIIVNISKAYVDRMGELVTMLEGIVAVDTGRTSELTQARARLLQAEAARSVAESAVRDVEINLRKKIGEGQLPPLPYSSNWHLLPPDLDVLLSEAANHPVIQQAQAQATSNELQADVVRSSSLPQINWVVGKSTGEDAFGREPAWQTSLTMSWSAFRGGSSRAAERAARQRAEAGRQSAEHQALDLEYRIRAASQDAQALLKRADLYRGLSVESNRVREAFFEQWHHLGRRTLLDVLISESDHYNNQVSEIANRFDGYSAIVRQYASSGTLIRWLSAGK